MTSVQQHSADLLYSGSHSFQSCRHYMHVLLNVFGLPTTHQPHSNNEPNKYQKYTTQTDRQTQYSQAAVSQYTDSIPSDIGHRL